MIAPLWFALGMLAGALSVAWVLGRREAAERRQKARGYAITFPTLDAAADAYTGRGKVMRLEVFGAFPLKPQEVEHVGARYLAALQRENRRKAPPFQPPPRSQTQAIQMLDPTETIQAIKRDAPGNIGLEEMKAMHVIKKGPDDAGGQ